MHFLWKIMICYGIAIVNLLLGFCCCFLSHCLYIIILQMKGGAFLHWFIFHSLPALNKHTDSEAEGSNTNKLQTWQLWQWNENSLQFSSLFLNVPCKVVNTAKRYSSPPKLPFFPIDYSPHRETFCVSIRNKAGSLCLHREQSRLLVSP